MNKIKFGHNYPKSCKQTKARLIEVNYLTKINNDLKEYDTLWDDNGDIGYYELPPGLKLQLVFIGNKDIPFCTIRKQTPKKETYYRNLIGEWFEVVVDNE